MARPKTFSTTRFKCEFLEFPLCILNFFCETAGSVDSLFVTVACAPLNIHLAASGSVLLSFCGTPAF